MAYSGGQWHHMEPSNSHILDAIRRLEQKVDTLIAALAQDDDTDQPTRTLDGHVFHGERDQTRGLG